MRGERIRRTRAKTLWSDFHARAVEPLAELERGSGWPDPKWQKNPCGFAREVLGLFLMPQQEGILLSARDNPKTAVRSGQKTGKTKTLAILALWWFCSFPGGRVVMTATGKKQVRNILWRELRDTRKGARVLIDGAWSDNPETGFRSTDGREIYGIAVREIEALGGISGGALLILADEASAIEPDKGEALEGNLAGAGMQRMVWLANPTRSEGPLYEAFHARKAFWNGHHLDGEEVAAWHKKAKGEIAKWQATHGQPVTGALPGVVTASTLERWREEYGPDSALYTVRARGNFLVHEQGKICSLHLISQAQERYEESAGEGDVLQIGVDPAGAGDGGDEWGFAAVRGQRLEYLAAQRGLSEDDGIQYVLGVIRTQRRDDDEVRVVLDMEGPNGSQFFYRLRALSEHLREKKPDEAFDVYGVKASARAQREPLIYERVREELWASVAKWLRQGGAVPADARLEAELHSPEWQGTVTGRLKATDKDTIREKLQRSPDRADALCLAVWQPFVMIDAGEGPARADDYEEAYGGTFRAGEAMDVYGGQEWWRRG